MCRLLVIKQNQESEINYILKEFANKCKTSKEYQGDGWGITYLVDGKWHSFKQITPIWDFNFQLPKIKMALVHARSAYRDEGIEIENNMPFTKSDFIFIFNGELNQVKIKEKGRIGAEKLFNFILRFEKYGLMNAISKALEIIKQKSEYIRAMDFIILDTNSLKIYINSYYNEDEDYFNLNYFDSNDIQIISSEILTGFNWLQFQNKSLVMLK